MDTALVPKAQTENVFQFSKPLPVTNSSVDSKSVGENEDCYKFSQPLDALSSKSTNGTETSSVTSPVNSSTFTGFGNQFKRRRKEWECNVCMVYNTPELEKCVGCDAPRKATILPADSSFLQQLKKSADKWECDTCMIQNTQEKTKCIACETPRKVSCYKSEPDEGFKTLASEQKATKWECSACMTQNDNECIKCVGCEQGKPCDTKMSEETQSQAVSKFTFGFGNGTDRPTENDLRKAAGIKTEKSATEFIFGFTNLSSQQKPSKWEWENIENLSPFFYPPEVKFRLRNGNNPGKTIIAPQRLFQFSWKPLKTKGWECDTCLVRNKLESVKCVCCESVRPKDSKWECDACMTQNDNECIKCVCCQQGKPGDTKMSEETQSQAVSKFTFGFGNGTERPTENDLRKAAGIETEKSATEFIFGFTNLSSQQKPSKWEWENIENLSPFSYPPVMLFGLGNGNNPGKTIIAPQRLFQFGCKPLKPKGWECDTCLVRNKLESVKCVCCEQGKPGDTKMSKETQSQVVSKFTFGFGNGTDRPTENDLRKNAGIETEKPELEKCVAYDAPRKATILPADSSLGQQPKKSADKWECDTCMIQNTQEKTKCIACETPRKGSCYKSEPDEGFKTLASEQKASKWECSACMSQNDNECIKCVCCEQGKPGDTKMSEETQSQAVSKFTFGFGNGIDRPTENDLRKTAGIETVKPTEFIFGITNLSSQQKTSKWEWDNIEELKPFSAPRAFKFGFSNGNNAGKTIIAPQHLFQFGFKPLKPKGWQCDTCFIRNKLESVKCICCESVRPKDYKKKTASTTNILFGCPPQGKVSTKNELKNELDSKTSEIKKSTSEANNEKQLKFGFTSNTTSFDVEFKSLAALQKFLKWECKTCMTQNDTDKTKCVCCEEEKPVVKTSELKSEVKKANNFTFGFAPKETKNVNPNTSTDSGFKALVDQQQASKWECDACMIQNDISLLKCACCEQVKPGEKLEVKSALQNEVSAPKFRFGFGNGNNAPTEEELRQKM